MQILTGPTTIFPCDDEFESFFSDPGILDMPNISADATECLPKFNLRMGMFQGTTKVNPGILILENGRNKGARIDGVPRITQAKMRALFLDLRAMCLCPVRAAADGMFVDSVRARVGGSKSDLVVHSSEIRTMMKCDSAFVTDTKIEAYINATADQRRFDTTLDPTNEVLVQQSEFNRMTEDEMDLCLDEGFKVLDETMEGMGDKENVLPARQRCEETHERIHAINIRGKFPGSSNSVSIYIFDTGMIKVSGGTSDGHSRTTGSCEYELFVNNMVIKYGMNKCAVFLAHLSEVPPLHICMINAVAKMSEQTRISISEPSVFSLFRDIMTSEANFEGTVFKSVGLARSSTSQLVIRMDDESPARDVYGPGTVKLSRTGGSVWFAGFRSVDCILAVMRMLDDLLKRMSGNVFQIPLYLSEEDAVGNQFFTGQYDKEGKPVHGECDPTWLEYRVRSNLLRTTQRLKRTYNKQKSKATRQPLQPV